MPNHGCYSFRVWCRVIRIPGQDKALSAAHRSSQPPAGLAATSSQHSYDPTERFHDHFEDHGNCEKDDRPAQTAFSEVLL